VCVYIYTHTHTHTHIVGATHPKMEARGCEMIRVTCWDRVGSGVSWGLRTSAGGRVVSLPLPCITLTLDLGQRWL